MPVFSFVALTNLQKLSKMKTVTPIIIIATLITNATMAQNTQTNIYNDRNNQDISYQKIAAAPITGSTIDIQDVNTKAIKDFAKFCKEAKEVKWFTEKDCAVAFFKNSDGSNRRYYDQKGNFICNILSCEEAYLPASITDMVKSTYYLNYHIISAEEIKTAEKKFYFVFIENKNSWKKLMVYDNEMEIINECFN